MAIQFILYICLAEITIRYISPQTTYTQLIDSVGSYYQESEYNTFKLRSNWSGMQPSMETPPDRVAIRINSSGMRGEEIDARKKILILGDSYTFGVYVDELSTYPAAVEKFLNGNNYKYQVLNAGYADGYETDQQYVWLKRNISVIRPELVILGVFLGNDIRGINEEAWRDLDEYALPSKWINNDLWIDTLGRLRNKKSSLMTVGASNIYQLPILRNSHLALLFFRSIRKAMTILKLTNESGYAVNSFQHIFGIYDELFLNRERLFLNIIDGMKTICDSTHTRFAIVLIPANFMIEKKFLDYIIPNSPFRNSESVYYNRLQPLLERKNINVLNLETMMNSSTKGPFFPKNGEIHFNKNGNMFAGSTIGKWIIDNNLTMPHFHGADASDR